MVSVPYGMDYVVAVSPSWQYQYRHVVLGMRRLCFSGR